MDLQNIKIEKQFILSKIEPWFTRAKTEFSSNDSSQKTKELIDIGKFIFCFDKEISIVDAFREKPDFHVLYNDQNVGIELTDVVLRAIEREQEGVLKKILGELEKDLETHTDYKGIYRISFTDAVPVEALDKTRFINQNKVALKNEILSLIKNEGSLGSLVSIKKNYHTQVHIYHSYADIFGSLDRTVVDANIAKKEKKYSTYSSTFDKLWLLLVMDGLKSSGDYSFIEQNVFTEAYKTRFDKVFLMDFFKSEVFELKTSKSTN